MHYDILYLPGYLVYMAMYTWVEDVFLTLFIFTSEVAVWNERLMFTPDAHITWLCLIPDRQFFYQFQISMSFRQKIAIGKYILAAYT